MVNFRSYNEAEIRRCMRESALDIQRMRSQEETSELIYALKDGIAVIFSGSFELLGRGQLTTEEEAVLIATIHTVLSTPCV